jgi:excisionase family DNA binding protein
VGALADVETDVVAHKPTSFDRSHYFSHPRMSLASSTLLSDDPLIVIGGLWGHPEDRGAIRGRRQLCQELGMGKSWLYRRLRSGEIPSIRVERSIKVRRDELEQYLERHHYLGRSHALQEEDSPPH